MVVTTQEKENIEQRAEEKKDMRVHPQQLERRQDPEPLWAVVVFCSKKNKEKEPKKQVAENLWPHFAALDENENACQERQGTEEKRSLLHGAPHGIECSDGQYYLCNDQELESACNVHSIHDHFA